MVHAVNAGTLSDDERVVLQQLSDAGRKPEPYVAGQLRARRRRMTEPADLALLDRLLSAADAPQPTVAAGGEPAANAGLGGSR